MKFIMTHHQLGCAHFMVGPCRLVQRRSWPLFKLSSNSHCSSWGCCTRHGSGLPKGNWSWCRRLGSWSP
jgi:hypothetical protein